MKVFGLKKWLAYVSHLFIRAIQTASIKGFDRILCALKFAHFVLFSKEKAVRYFTNKTNSIKTLSFV